MLLALLTALTAYCQLHSAAHAGRVPIGVSFSWAIVTAATWTGVAFLAWRWRGRLLAMLASRSAGQIAKAAAILFLLALVAANAAMLFELVRLEVTPAGLVQRVLRYGPAAAATAGFACCWLLLQRRRSAPPTSEWLHLPQEPLLMLRSAELQLIRSAGNYCELHANGRVHLVRTTLKDLEAQLEA